MHGNNIYSTSILKEAKAENIKFTIIEELCPRKDKEQLPKDFFKPIQAAIEKVANGNKKIEKYQINILSGFLGKEYNNKNIGRN